MFVRVCSVIVLVQCGIIPVGRQLSCQYIIGEGELVIAESSTRRDVASWSSRREFSAGRSRSGCGCSVGRDLSPSAWTFLLCCAFSSLSSLCRSLSFSSWRASLAPAWRNRSSSLCNLSSSRSLRISSSSLCILARMAEGFPSWLACWPSWLFLVVTIVARSISAPRWAPKCYRTGSVGSSNNNISSCWFTDCSKICSLVYQML